MEITLTPEQYKNLIEMVYLGEWMINACRHPDEVIKKYQDLEQHIYSFAEAGGLKRYIERDEKSGEFFQTDEFEAESKAEEYRLDFEEETFWDELIDRFAVRDLVREIGEEAAKNMDPVEYYGKKIPFLVKYETEFEERGIERLEVAAKEGAKADDR